MRTIKFRWWNKYDNKMQYNLEDVSCKSFSSYENLMQWTGLTDKNGKEIYEGDVVKCQALLSGEYFNREVIYSAGGFIANGCLGVNNHTLEVIGNVWENPELLKS